MAEPRCNPTLFGAYFGGIGGSVVGIIGGLLGTLMGVLAPRGRGRAVVTLIAAITFVAGLASLAAGTVALCSGQPYAIWYPLLLLGVIVVTVIGMLLFVQIPRIYAMAEARRLAAEELRSGA
jgi:hypothetical protein